MIVAPDTRSLQKREFIKISGKLGRARNLRKVLIKDKLGNNLNLKVIYCQPPKIKQKARTLISEMTKLQKRLNAKCRTVGVSGRVATRTG